MRGLGWVEAQRRAIKDGVSRPWEFASLVRRFHAQARPAGEPTAMERFRIELELVHGPGEFTDKELKEQWLDWGREKLLGRDYWNDRECYGYWRWEKRLPLKRR